MRVQHSGGSFALCLDDNGMADESKAAAPRRATWRSGQRNRGDFKNPIQPEHFSHAALLHAQLRESGDPRTASAASLAP